MKKYKIEDVHYLGDDTVNCPEIDAGVANEYVYINSSDYDLVSLMWENLKEEYNEPGKFEDGAGFAVYVIEVNEDGDVLECEQVAEWNKYKAEHKAKEIF